MREGEVWLLRKPGMAKGGCTPAARLELVGGVPLGSITSHCFGK